MRSGWWQMIGMSALLWLMMSDTIDRLIPVPVPVLDHEVLRAGVPGLVETDGQPDLQATLARLRAAAMADPQSRLGKLLAVADETTPIVKWPDLLLVRESPLLLRQAVDRQLLDYDRVAFLMVVLDGLKQLDDPTSAAGKRVGTAFREQPPDPTYAATLVLDWYATAAIAVSTGEPLPEVPQGSPRLTASRARPLAERMVDPMTLSERSKATAELWVNSLLAKRRTMFEALRKRVATPTTSSAPAPTASTIP